MNPMPEKIEEWERIISVSPTYQNAIIKSLGKFYNDYDFKAEVKEYYGHTYVNILVGAGLDDIQISELYGFCRGLLCMMED